MSPYALYLLAAVCQLGLLALATDLLAGHTGRVGLAGVLLAGIGGYTYAVLCAKVGFAPWPSIALALCLTVMIATVVGRLLITLDSEWYLLVTFALQVAFVDLMNNSTITGGPLGLTNLPMPSLSRGPSDASVGALYLLLPASVVAIAFLGFLLSQKNPIGRQIHAIRDDMPSALALGLRVRFVLVSVFTLHAVLAALAGIGGVVVLSYVNPSAFGLWLSVLALTAMFVGGTGGQPHFTFLGAAFVIAVSEVVSVFSTNPSTVGPLQQIMLNAVLIAVLVVRKRGFAGPIIEVSAAGERQM